MDQVYNKHSKTQHARSVPAKIENHRHFIPTANKLSSDGKVRILALLRSIEASRGKKGGGSLRS